MPDAAYPGVRQLTDAIVRIEHGLRGIDHEPATPQRDSAPLQATLVAGGQRW